MVIYDAFGREVTSIKRPVTEEITTASVRDRYNSYPSQGLTPERLALIFREADQGDVYRQSELFEEMEEKDAHLGSALQMRKLAVAGLESEVLPASAASEDVRIADAAKEMLGYIENLDEALTDILDALGKGFSVQEIIWEMSGRAWWIKSLNWVHQRRFTFTGPPVRDDKNGLTMQPLLKLPRLLTDREQVWGEELAPYKFVYHRAKTRSGIAPRSGLLRPCAYMYLFKNYDIKDWLIFNELYSVPMRLGKYQAGTPKDEVEKLKQAVFNLGVDAAAVVSDSTIIELLESNVRGETSSFKDLAEYCEKAMTKAVLGHAGSSEGTPGRLGGEDHAEELRQDLLEADAKALMKTIRAQVLAPWVAYNFGPDRAVPEFKLHYAKDEDLKSVAEVYGVLVRDVNFRGIPVKHIHERFNIPTPEPGEPTVSAEAPAPKDVMKNRTDMPGLPAAGLIEAQTRIDSLTDNSLAGMQGNHAGAPLLRDMYRIIDEATSYEDLQGRIAEIYQGIDTAQMQELMARACFMADLEGRSL